MRIGSVLGWLEAEPSGGRQAGKGAGRLGRQDGAGGNGRRKAGRQGDVYCCQHDLFARGAGTARGHGGRFPFCFNPCRRVKAGAMGSGSFLRRGKYNRSAGLLSTPGPRVSDFFGIAARGRETEAGCGTAHCEYSACCSPSLHRRTSAPGRAILAGCVRGRPAFERRDSHSFASRIGNFSARAAHGSRLAAGFCAVD